MVPIVYNDSPFPQHAACIAARDLYEYLKNNSKDDPYVIALQSDGHEVNPKKLKKALSGKTFCQEQSKKLSIMALDVHVELGPWASAHYLYSCISKFEKGRVDTILTADDVGRKEYQYLTQCFDRFIPAHDISETPKAEALSHKVNLLVDSLAGEINDHFAAIVFVRTRASVWLLRHLLENDPRTSHLLRIGTFVGTSSHQNRTENISGLVDVEGQDDALEGLRTGKKNLIISTSVCEEGLDISACNLVVCFERPPNLKSFIQRRGRARRTDSRYLIMLAEHETVLLENWKTLEQQMKEMYMDELRQVEELERLESGEQGYREFFIPSTGAKLFLDDSTRHLFHFCNTLPSNGYIAAEPIFTFREHQDNGLISCHVLLPSSVDASVRQFNSASAWKTERLARSDAAFEAYVHLYKAGLVNDNLMPIDVVDKDIQKVLAELQKRPNVVTVDGQLDPWRLIATKWLTGSTVYSHSATVALSDGSSIAMQLICSVQLCLVPGLRLYIDKGTTAELTIQNTTGDGLIMLEGAAKVTHTILNAGLWNRMDGLRNSFPVLCIPNEALQDCQGWQTRVSGTVKAAEMLAQESLSKTGLIRDSNFSNSAFVYHSVEEVYDEGGDDLAATALKLKVKKFPKRRNFLQRIDAAPDSQGSGMSSHDLSSCSVELLPVQYAWFSIFFPSILAHLGHFLVAKQLCESLLLSVELSNVALVQSAITAPAAGTASDYQKLEFLGDSLLKFQCSLTLISTHRRWHEGILSRAKDHIVSNGNLSATAHVLGLAKFILTKSLTWHGWRMPYNEDILELTEPEDRELSTKVLADVVEALLGAAYLDGGEEKLLRCLRTLLPRSEWPSTADCYQALSQAAVSLEDNALPEQYKPLETLIGYDFRNKGLLIEAITHASYQSTSKLGSYQRLEYLGDAILDNIVTKTIYAHNPDMPVPKMHLLRSTSVNGNLLAFLAMSRTVAVDFAEIVPPSADSEPTIFPSKKHLSLSMFLRAAPISQLTLALQQTYKRHEASRDTIDRQLHHGDRYPWTELAALNAEKVVSDLVESTLGAVVIDSGGDMVACERWLENLGVLPWLRQAMDRDVSLLHPKEGLGIVANTMSVVYKTTPFKEQVIDQTESEVSELRYRTIVSVGDREICAATGVSRMDAETRAADQALDVLRAEGKDTAAQMDTVSRDDGADENDEDDTIDDEFQDAHSDMSM